MHGDHMRQISIGVDYVGLWACIGLMSVPNAVAATQCCHNQWMQRPSLDKVGDADLILRKTLQRMGVWGGGSQTPITTPYAPPSVKTSSDDGAATSSHASEMINQYFSELTSSSRRETPAPLSSCNSSLVPSVVPARMLKYMRLLMHHEVSTNAFSVVVRFDPRPSHWELMKRGMVSPQSLPSRPTL
ncbi:unnamed protein product [Peronospora effusa]|nr:unnamed protein product [Peronospora effusa]